MLFGKVSFGKDHYISEDKYVPKNQYSDFRVVTYFRKETQPYSISACKAYSPHSVTSLWGGQRSSENVLLRSLLYGRKGRIAIKQV